MRSGFAAVVGRPNTGKSTLVNALVGAKVSITSSRPQTTRNTIRGVLHRPEAQVVFVDTPGLHRPRSALGERLNRLVYGTLADTEAALFVLDATRAIGPGDRRVAERVREAEAVVLVIVNKIDAASPAQVAAQLAEAGQWGFAAYVPVSAREDDNLGAVVDELVPLLPEGPAYFPPDMRTDQPEEFLAGEIVREKFLDRLRDELPHSLAVVTDDYRVRPDGTLYYSVRVVVERETQKGIVIGKGGRLLAAAGTEARHELEALFGAKVFLDLRVHVEKDWQRRDQLLDRLGF